jgi:hypothetical protein
MCAVVRLTKGSNMPVPARNAADTLDVTALLDQGNLGGFQFCIIVLLAW